jgi:hypothetical protein
MFIMPGLAPGICFVTVESDRDEPDGEGAYCVQSIFSSA